MLPEIIKNPLKEHLKKVWHLHQKDLKDGYGKVSMPYALSRMPIENGAGSMCSHP
jgi:hypothetical protein